MNNLLNKAKAIIKGDRSVLNDIPVVPEVSPVKNMSNDGLDIFKFPLGVKARDIITGFEGVIVCRNQWLTNCNQYALQPVKLKDGKVMDKYWIDEPQMELIKIKVEEPVKQKRDTGGPAKPVPNTRL